jgi:uncharacterized protein YndB with AHSA1/START domain
MVEPNMDFAVQRSITVEAPQARAFEVFTEGLASWWPLDGYSIGKERPVTAVLEPGVGGRWYERAADGSECDWGRVLAWDPPERVVLAWQISADWRPDPTAASEVEVSFHAEGEGKTRVELAHRGLETYGNQAQDMREQLGSPHGWDALLERYAATAKEAA